MRAAKMINNTFLAKRWLLLNNFFLQAILVTSLYAQPSRVKFERISIEQGLSQSSINTILQDSEGFLWFGTQEGLNKYDGYEFRIYKHRPNNPNSLAHNWIKTLTEDCFGNIWIGTFGGGLSMFDRQQNKFYNFQYDSANPGSLSNNTVLALWEDNNHFLWIGTYNGLEQLRLPLESKSTTGLPPHPKVASFRHFRKLPDSLESLNSDTVLTIYQNGQETLWIGTPAGLAKLKLDDQNIARFFHFPVLPTQKRKLAVTAIGDAGDGYLWVGTPEGLFRFDIIQKTFIKIDNQTTPPGSTHNFHVTSLLTDRNGALWIGSRSGLARFSPNPSTNADSWQIHFEHFQNLPYDLSSLSDNNVLSLYEDHAGVIWVGTKVGINKFAPALLKFPHITQTPGNPHGLSSRRVYSIYEDHNQVLWIGTDNGLNQALPDGWESDNTEDVHFVHFPLQPHNRLSSPFILSLTEDAEGLLWIGTADGLNQLDARRKQVKFFKHNAFDPHSLGHNTIFSLLADRQGDLWIGTAGGGLSRLKREDRERQHFTRYRHKPGDGQTLSDNYVFTIYQDNTDTLWIGTALGLNKFFSRENRFIHYQHDPGNPKSLSNNTVFCIYEPPPDSSGKKTLWLGTRGGLVKFDREREEFFHYRSEDGLPNEVIYGILADDRGNLWVSTNQGLSRFDPRAQTFRNYYATDGLQSNEFNQGAYFKNPNGYLFFGGINGFNRFKPTEILDNSYIPPIVLTAFRKFDRLVEMEQALSQLQPIQLSYKDNFFSLEFAALDFTNPDRNQYAYKLEGFDREWIYCGNRRYASYTNLDGGTYTFRVKGSNNDRVWNENGTAITIRVIPPPWKTWWAYTLYGLLLLGSVLGFVGLRTKAQAKKIKQQQIVVESLKRLDRLKDEFLANTSHELRTPLNGIIGIAESMLDGATGELSEMQHRNIFLIVTSGRRLANLINDILDFSRLKNKDIILQCKPVNMRLLTEVVFAISKPLVGNKPLEMINEIPEDLPTVNGDESRLQQILQNLIGNAIKFTAQGRISVSGVDRGDSVEICVADTGIGIPKDKFEDIFKSFEQVDASISREYGGTGIGLSITRQLVHLHGGTIRVQSELGQGAKFIFTLPVKDQKENEVNEEPYTIQYPKSREEPVTPLQLPLANRPENIPLNGGNSNALSKILIVDDEVVNLQVLQNFLSLRHYQVIKCTNGMEALSLIREQNLQPDLLLLDVMMPKMSGYEVCSILRKEYSLYELPILMLTAKSRTEDLLAGFESGANDYLSKPFDKRELLSRINTLLDLKKAIQEHDELVALQQELKVARRIQESILPQKIPRLVGADVQARYIPMATVGGDFYDFHIINEHELGVLVADVSGHGIPAAFISAMVKIAFSSEASNAADVERLLSKMNNTLTGKFSNHFVTASYSHIDLQNRILSHADAGHMPAVIWRTRENSLIEVKPRGLILGWAPTITCPVLRVPLEAGDRILLYTDGILESQNPAGEFFEEKEFSKFIANHQNLPAAEFADTLLNYISSWSCRSNGFVDDLTIIVIDIL